MAIRKIGMLGLVSFALLNHNLLAATKTTFTVAADGSGEFKTLQEAIAALPDNSEVALTLQIKPGTYQGQIIVPRSKTNVVFQGQTTEKTIITFSFNTNEDNPEGVTQSNKGTGVVVDADGFRADKITFQNASGDHGQALALKLNGDRAVVTNCRLLGWQDTLMVNNARQYFRDCYIEGRVDFIYGSGTAVFDQCRIHSKNGGYVTAASTPPEKTYGLVFLKCKLTGSPEPWIDPKIGKLKPDQRSGAATMLGRPWGANAQVAFISCEMGDHIRPEAWDNWGNAANEKTARYVEFNSHTPARKPIDVSKRALWSKQLSAEEAAKYTVAKIFDDVWSSWDPTAPVGKSDDVIILSAKNVKIVGDHAKADPKDDVMHHWSSTDTKFTWQATLQPGKYRVGYHYSADPDKEGNEIAIDVGNQTFNIAPKSTGHWSKYQIIPAGEVEITKAGPVQVTIRAISQKGQWNMNVRGVVIKKLKAH